MLSNAYFLAKFRFDTAENEPAKNLQNFIDKFKEILQNLRILQNSGRAVLRPRGGPGLRQRRRGAATQARNHAGAEVRGRQPADQRKFCKFWAKCPSFSAVSALIFASKYAF